MIRINQRLRLYCQGKCEWSILLFSVTELEPLLINLRLKASGKGDVVVQQSPKPGEKVKEGSTIRIYLDNKDGASD